MRPMLRVGLTGNIGCGKSTAARILGKMGALVIPADAIGHEMLRRGTDVYAAVVAEFGPSILDAAGEIDRKKLGSLVFASREKLDRLNSLVHPAVRGEVARRIREMATENPHAIILVESALMIETGFYRQFERVLVITCNREVQIRRTMGRSGVSREEVEARLLRQMPQEEKAGISGFSIDNSGSEVEFRLQLRAVWLDLVRLEAALPENS
jgi:dephospho-CoA kinase